MKNNQTCGIQSLLFIVLISWIPASKNFSESKSNQNRFLSISRIVKKPKSEKTHFSYTKFNRNRTLKSRIIEQPFCTEIPARINQNPKQSSNYTQLLANFNQFHKKINWNPYLDRRNCLFFDKGWVQIKESKVIQLKTVLIG